MKKKLTQIGFVILSLVFVLSTCMVVMAKTAPVTGTQDGLVATLDCDKDEYLAGDNVKVTLNVKNNNSYAVNDVETQIILPNEIKVTSGNLTQEKFTLDANSEKTTEELSFTKTVVAEKEESPKTGDNSHIGIYITLMVVSGTALVILFVKKKKLNKVMPMVLCFALLGTVMITPVVNAAPLAKSFTVEKTIKYANEDMVIKANISYAYVKYSNATVTNGTGTGLYAEGTTVTIKAEDAPEGKHFTGWTVTKGNVTLQDKTSATTTFVMGTEDVEIKAEYEVNTYTIDVTLGENGKVTPEGNISVKYGESKKVTITANEGYHIENLESSGKKYQNTLGNKWKSFTIDYNNVGGNYYVKADFAIDTFTISASVNESSMGTITETATVNYGDSKTFTIAPKTGYKVKDVMVDDVSIGAKTSYEFKNITADHTIDVTFTIQTFTITASVNDTSMGTITETANVNYGDSKTFTIAANTDYHIVDVEVDGVSKGAITSYTFENVNETHTIKATFAINTYTITATAGANGTITESARLNAGGSKTFTMTANSGYGVKDVKVDGNSVGPVTSYTFENVNENHTIEVEFDRATFVFTAQEFRNAVTKDGIIILANDITLDDNGNVEISKNVIIHGGGHTIIGERYEGVGYSRGAFVILIGNAKAEIENCNFNYSGNHVGGLDLKDNSEAEIFGGDYSQIFTSGSSNLIIHYGNFTELEMYAYSKVNIYGGVYGQKNKKSWDYSLNEPFSSITISLHGGTYYFDPTSYLDKDKYQTTQTKDADNVDIWVVTEK